MVTKEQLLEEMVSQLDFYAMDYKEDYKTKDLDIIAKSYEDNATTYNVLLFRLFNHTAMLPTTIEKYIVKRENDECKTLTKEQIIKEMISHLDSYANEYKMHLKFKDLDIIIQSYEDNAITYNVLLYGLFKIHGMFPTTIEKYIVKREKEAWK